MTRGAPFGVPLFVCQAATANVWALSAAESMELIVMP